MSNLQERVKELSEPKDYGQAHSCTIQELSIQNANFSLCNNKQYLYHYPAKTMDPVAKTLSASPEFLKAIVGIALSEADKIWSCELEKVVAVMPLNPHLTRRHPNFRLKIPIVVIQLLKIMHLRNQSSQITMTP
jgi:hypothetical protein